MSLGPTSALATGRELGRSIEWLLCHLLLLVHQATVSKILLWELLFKAFVLGSTSILRHSLDLVLLL